MTFFSAKASFEVVVLWKSSKCVSKHQGRLAIAKVYSGSVSPTFVPYPSVSSANGALRRTLNIPPGQPLAENTAQLWGHDERSV